MKRRLRRLLKRRPPLKIMAPVLLVVVVILIIVVSSGGGDDKKDKASTTATGPSTNPAGVVTTPGGGRGGKSMFEPAKLTSATNQVKSRIGSGAQMIQVTVSDSGAQFQYARAGRPGFFLSDPTTSKIRSLKTTHLRANDKRLTFPLSSLDPAVPAELRDKAPDVGGSDFHATSLTLKRDPVSKKIVWTVLDTDHPKLVPLNARPDGSGLKKAF